MNTAWKISVMVMAILLSLFAMWHAWNGVYDRATFDLVASYLMARSAGLP